MAGHHSQYSPVIGHPSHPQSDCINLSLSHQAYSLSYKDQRTRRSLSPGIPPLWRTVSRIKMDINAGWSQAYTQLQTAICPKRMGDHLCCLQHVRPLHPDLLCPFTTKITKYVASASLQTLMLTLINMELVCGLWPWCEIHILSSSTVIHLFINSGWVRMPLVSSR